MNIVEGARTHQEPDAAQEEDSSRPFIAFFNVFRSQHVWIVVVASILWALSSAAGINSLCRVLGLFALATIAESIPLRIIGGWLRSAFSRIREFSLFLATVTFAIVVPSITVTLILSVYALTEAAPRPALSSLIPNMIVGMAIASLGKFPVDVARAIAHIARTARRLERVLSSSESQSTPNRILREIESLLGGANETESALSAPGIGDRPGSR